MTHKQTIEIIDKFLEYNKEYRTKKEAKTESLKDEVIWIDLYKKSMIAINEYDVDQIKFGGEKKK